MSNLRAIFPNSKGSVGRMKKRDTPLKPECQFTMIDLCSGFGGASEAMYQNEKWCVVRFENNPLLADVPNTELVDITSDYFVYLMEVLEDPVTLLWASPPCHEFSLAYGSPRSIAIREGREDEYHPDMEILEYVLLAKAILDPSYWVIENVSGSVKYFEPYLGKPRQRVGPFVLWHNLPYEINMGKNMGYVSRNENDKHSANPLRANYKAMIPFDLSNHVRNICESPTLHDFIGSEKI